MQKMIRTGFVAFVVYERWGLNIGIFIVVSHTFLEIKQPKKCTQV